MVRGSFRLELVIMINHLVCNVSTQMLEQLHLAIMLQEYNKVR